MMLIQIGVEAVYRHEYDYFLLRYFFILAGKERFERRRKLFLSTSRRKTALDKLWPYFVYIDALFLILWLKFTKRRAIVILDRFLYDQLISFEGLGVASRLVQWLFIVAPSPDIAIVLTISPEIAYQRKKDSHEYTLQFYKRGYMRYLELAKRLRLTTVDTNSPHSFVFNQVLEILLSNEKFMRIFINKGANNRVIYKVISEYELQIPKLKAVRKNYEQKVAKVQKTLRFVQELMEEIETEWLLFKSYMPFPHVPTYDVDILIRSSDRYKLVYLQSKGIPYSAEERDKINIRLPNLYTISIHFGATWSGINYVSSETLWRDVRNVVWHGFSVKVPSYSSELLTHAAHIFFELSFIRLADALYLSELIKRDINLKLLLSETECYNWKMAFVLVVRLVERLIYNKKIKVPNPIPYGYIVKILMGIIYNDIKKKSFSINKAREYARQIVRYAIWRLGAKILGRAPFGEILEASGH